jgi:outer membrane protein assembly factor BamB
MHDGTINQGDQWLQSHLGPYVDWAYAHHSLMILTWDENDGSKANQIPTILVGAGLLSGTDDTRSTHYTVLRTIEDSYGLPRLGSSATAAPLTADWQYFAALVVGGDRIWSLDPAHGIVYALDPATGKSVAQVNVGTTSRFATPAISGPDLIISTLTGLTSIRTS